MSDLISRSTVIDQIAEFLSPKGLDEWEVMVEIREIIENAPAVDAVPVVHARWIFRKDPKHSYCTQAVCSACKHIAKSNADLIVDNMKAYFAEDNRFCRNCGARMDGEENG